MEKRKETRYFTFGMVFNEQNKRIGYLLDISNSGMQVRVYKKFRDLPLSNLLVKPMRAANILEFNVEVKEARRNESSDFIEIGLIILNANPIERLKDTIEFIKDN